jgi:hypothetical protein
VHISIGIIAWNEAETIGTVLGSVLGQTLFEQAGREGQTVEILVVANGCSDATGERAAETLAKLHRSHPGAASIRWEVRNLEERGKLNAWNRFVHAFSARESGYLFLLDADIILRGRDTLLNMWRTLRETPEASVCVDTPRKAFAGGRGLVGNRLSTRASQITAAAPGQLTGQLYCIRSEVARNIYLPKDLPACDDGFIKALVCTDSLTAPLNNDRIVVARDAAHDFEAYTALRAVLRNQKRQIIGQTVVHILVDKHLPTLPLPARQRMAETLMHKDATDPDWLKRLIAEHVAERRFPWRLYPRLLTHRLKGLSKLGPAQRLACMPAAIAQLAVTLAASWMAYRFLRGGSIDYWPRAGRRGRQAPDNSPGGHTTAGKLIENSL